jgi:2',3'-cyclic-nucleotide 2'-phosphodiesterase (5'-nucleotidase family)
MHKTCNLGRIAGVYGALVLTVLLLLSTGVSAQQPSADSASRAATQSTGPAASSTVKPELRSRVNETRVDDKIADDPALDRMLEPYSARVKALQVVIGHLDDELRKTGPGAGSLGNFVTDAMRVIASAKVGQPIDLAITNGGGLRKNAFAAGDLRVSDFYELMPFENKLVVLEMSGAQVLQVLQALAAGRDAQSGAAIVYHTNADKRSELVSANLIGSDGKPKAIDPAATYRVVTIDYLLNVSGGSYAVFHEAKTTNQLGVTIRDAMIDYVKGETAAGRSIKARLDHRIVADDKEEQPQ